MRARSAGLCYHIWLCIKSVFFTLTKQVKAHVNEMLPAVTQSVLGTLCKGEDTYEVTIDQVFVAYAESTMLFTCSRKSLVLYIDCYTHDQQGVLVPQCIWVYLKVSSAPGLEYLIL